MSLSDKEINEMARKTSFKGLQDEVVGTHGDEDPVTMSATNFRVLMMKLSMLEKKVKELERGSPRTPGQMLNALPGSRKNRGKVL